jgi:hypothetical protein
MSQTSEGEFRNKPKGWRKFRNKLRMYEVIHVNIYGVPKFYVLKSGKVCAGKS